MRNSLANKFNLELPSTAIFDYPSVQALANFIANKQGGAEGPLEDEEDDEFSEEEEVDSPQVELEAIR